jgi:hypothetical protein
MPSRTIMIRPGSAMISASGASPMTGVDVAQVGAYLVVVRQKVAGDKKFLAARVGFGNANAGFAPA